MKILFEYALEPKMLATEPTLAKLTVELAGVSLDLLVPVGRSQPTETASPQPHQWALDVTGLTARFIFYSSSNGVLKEFTAKQDQQLLIIEAIKPVEIASTISAVLLSGSLIVPATQVTTAWKPTLVPPGCELRSIRSEPSGLHVGVQLPKVFFPVNRDSHEVVLRVPQSRELDCERLADLPQPYLPCWTLTEQPFGQNLTSRQLLNAWVSQVSTADSIVDNTSRRSSREPDRCAVRLGSVTSPSGVTEVRWVARRLELEISLAAGRRAQRTHEINFRPDVFIGAFNVNGELTTLPQFQALPQAQKQCPRWHRQQDLDKADYRLTFDGATFTQEFKSHEMAAFRGPVRESRFDVSAKLSSLKNEPRDIVEEAWLPLADGWLALRGRDLLRDMSDSISFMEQFRGVLDPFAWSAAFDMPVAPQARLQISAFDLHTDTQSVDNAGSLVAFLCPGQGKAALYLWNPLVILTTPPLWHKQPTTIPTEDSTIDSLREAADRLVPTLVPPPSLSLEEFDPGSRFGHFLFMSERVAVFPRPDKEKIGSKMYGLSATLTVDFESSWQLMFESDRCEIWHLPAGLPLAPNHPLVDVPCPGLTLDDRRGLIPFVPATDKPISVRFDLAMSGNTAPLPELQASVNSWIKEAGSWKISPQLSEQAFFLVTLAGVELPLAPGNDTPPKSRLRHANPALDESFARVTEDQDDRQRDLRLEFDTTRVTKAVAFKEGDEAVLGWVPGNTGIKLNGSKYTLTGLAPRLEISLDGVTFALTRPTLENRHADLVHLGLDVKWNGPFNTTISVVPPMSLEKAEKDPNYAAIVGSGQPLLVRPIKNNESVCVMDGVGDFFTNEEARPLQMRGGTKVERITETWKDLGSSNQGDGLTLELCGVTIGKRLAASRYDREERWQLHDGNWNPPRLRGFTVLPLSLDELSETSATLRVLLLPLIARPNPSEASAHRSEVEIAQSFREIVLRLGRDDQSVTIVSGGIDWLFPSGETVPALARIQADFEPNKKLENEFVKLNIKAVTLTTPTGRLELTQGDCYFTPPPPELEKTSWRFAFRAEQKDVPYSGPDAQDAPKFSAEIGWIILPAGSFDFPAAFPLRIVWTGDSNNPKTQWEVTYGISERVRRSDLKRILKKEDTSKISALKLKGELFNEFKSLWYENARRRVTRTRREYVADQLLDAINVWIDSPIVFDDLKKLVADKDKLVTWVQERSHLQMTIGKSLGAADRAWILRSIFEWELAIPSSGDWERRWETRLVLTYHTKKNSVLGFAVLQPVKLGATRHSFKITRDTRINQDERKQLNRHLRVDSLGGVLGAEVLRHAGHIFLANVAVQLQLVLRDRQRRDALGLWRPGSDSGPSSTFSIREDQIGELQAFAGFSKVTERRTNDIVWATLDPKGITRFATWDPEKNVLKELELVFQNPDDPVPRRVANVHPFLSRSLMVIDDRSRLTFLETHNLKKPTQPPKSEEILKREPEDDASVKLLATNYLFQQDEAAWVSGDKGCWQRLATGEIKHRFKTIPKIVALWYGKELLAASSTAVFSGNVDDESPVLLGRKYEDIRAISSLENAPLIVACVVKSEENSIIHLPELHWYSQKLRSINTSGAIPEEPLVIPLPLEGVEEIMPLGPGLLAVRYKAKVGVVKVEPEKPHSIYIPVDPGSLVPCEIDLLDEAPTGNLPKGDLLLRGPASRTLCTAILSFSPNSEPQLELSGKLVLQNDIRYFEKKEVDGNIIEADCTHRLDLFLDRARVPADLLFAGPAGDEKKDVFVAGIGHHVFRFSDGAERIWQIPQLVRFTRLANISGLLKSTSLSDDQKNELVIDASAVIWVEGAEKGDTSDARLGRRDPAAPPFDAFARGGAAVECPLFDIRLHSKPPGRFEEANLLRLPFLASTAFARLLNKTGRIDVPRIEIPHPDEDVKSRLYNRGAQHTLLPPRLVMQLITQGDSFNRSNNSIDFLSRTFLGRWMDSNFLQYCLMPEPIARNTTWGRESTGDALGDQPTSTTTDSLGWKMLWPALSRDAKELPKLLPDLADLRKFKPNSLASSPRRGDRRFLSAAAMAQKVENGSLNGPAIIEFPFYVDIHYADDDAISDALESVHNSSVEETASVLPDPTPSPSYDLQLIAYEAGTIRRLARETVLIPEPLDNKPAHNEGKSREINNFVTRWAREQKARLAWRAEALVVVNFQRILPVEADAIEGTEELSSALVFEPLPKVAYDPRNVLVISQPITAAEEPAPIIFAGLPLTDASGKAPPLSATAWSLARGGKSSGSLQPARVIEADKPPAGLTCHHYVTFDLTDMGHYPAPLPDRVCLLNSVPSSATEEPRGQVQPPWWQFIAWSDRPGELMTSSFRASENQPSTGGIVPVAVSAEQSLSLRRSRTATREGAGVRLDTLPELSPIHTGWKRFANAIQPRDLKLTQIMQQSHLPDGAVRLFICDNQGVLESTSTPDASAANPAILTRGSKPLPSLFLLAGKDWHPKEQSEGDSWKVKYLIRKYKPGEQEPPFETKERDKLNTDFEERRNDPDKTVAFITREEAEHIWVLHYSLKEEEASNEIFTYQLIEYTVTENSGQFTITIQVKAAISAVFIEARSRVKPLKTAIAILSYQNPSGRDARLAGYGQLGSERFSPIEPVVNQLQIPGHSKQLDIRWQRTALVRVIERNPVVTSSANTWRYALVVTGPSGETYPDLTPTN